jgi:hypothetical protein
VSAVNSSDPPWQKLEVSEISLFLSISYRILDSLDAFANSESGDFVIASWASMRRVDVREGFVLVPNP